MKFKLFGIKKDGEISWYTKEDNTSVKSIIAELKTVITSLNTDEIILTIERIQK